VSFIFLHPPDRPDLRHNYWAKFQACLEDEIPIKPDLYKVAIDTYVETLFGAVMKALVASTLMSRQRDDPMCSIPASIHDELCLKNWRWRQRQVTRDPTLRADITRL